MPCAQTPVKPPLARCMRGRRPLAAPRRPPRIVYPLSTRQLAYAFNQPLNFDTSRVINMDEMFEVHSTRALRPGPSLAFPLHCPLHARPPPPHRLPSISHAILWTRQGAKYFNQPLSSFDTRRVTIMGEMFRVHPVRALCSDFSV